ncbi:glycosyl transferase [Vibrio fluvialis]|uniref:glycosyl transferase n=1 Tax=Vibrio fluvialis TaxID=676 RepID=UPI001F2183E6|nr:glycosyl transferase [Vibrio fluvialis]MCE7650701.1 glycosyl transferase [Vibrio fluvialis]
MRIINNILLILKNLKSSDKITKFCLEKSNLENSLLYSKEALTSSEKYKNELIVSLTTYNKRIYDVSLVIESLGRQTLKANRIILWLDENEFNLDNIPYSLVKQMSRGLEIKFCPNYKSYKKIVPTLTLAPEADIITVDDDVIYPFDMIEGLVATESKFKNCIVAHHIHEISFDSRGEVKLYRDWKKNISDIQPSMKYMAVGVGGVLYPQGSLTKLTLDESVFSKLAPNADDVWLKAMTCLQNYSVVKAPHSTDFWERFISIESSQNIALFHENSNMGENDNQIKKVFREFGIVDKLNK